MINPLIALQGTSLNTAPAVQNLGNAIVQKKQLDRQADQDEIANDELNRRRLNEDEDRRFQSLLDDAVLFQEAHDAGDAEAMASVIDNRRRRIQKQKELGLVPDTTETDEIVQLANEGNFDELRSRADVLVEGGVRLGKIQPHSLPKITQAIDASDTAALQRLGIGGSFREGTVLEVQTQGGQLVGFNVAQQSDVKSPERLDQDIQTASARSTNVNVNTKVEEKGAIKEAEAIAGVRANRFDMIQQDALDAEEQNLGLDQLSRIDVKTGLGQGAITQVSRVINALGGDGEKLTGIDPANVQAFNSVTGKLVLDVMSNQKGPQTDKDQERISKTLPNIGNEELANEFNINSLKALNFRKIEMAEFYENYLEKNETLKGADREWAKFKRETPLLSDQVKNAETGLPMFFHEFKDKTLERNQHATKEQIIQAWREVNE